MRDKLADVIRSYRSPYLLRLTGSPSDVREYIALIDYYIKVTLALLAAYNNRVPLKIKLSATPGVGKMLSEIANAKKWAGSTDLAVSSLTRFSTSFLSLFSTNIYNGDTFKKIRNDFSHGLPLPLQDVDAKKVCDAVKDFSAIVWECLELELSKFSYQVENSSILAYFGNDMQPLSPVWDFNVADQVVGVYSNFGTDGVCYLCPVVGIYKNIFQDNTSAFVAQFLNKTPDEIYYGIFVCDLTKDISSFSEDNSPPYCDFGEDDYAGSIFLTWVMPTSDRSETRTDRFRIGQDNRYEWYDPAENVWVPYSAFLRRISHWKILARRLRIELDRELQKLRIGSLGELYSSDIDKGPVNLKRENNEDGELVDIKVVADNACSSSKPFTKVFFIVGDAGMGKTELLLSAALERAKQVELNERCCEPLYVYVSSAGRALSNLEDAVNSALSITKILNNKSARTLCKNGLLVLIVDGFDELLGNSSYDNPLGSLENWFRDLKGRGVLIASARSSYYMVRYRKSLIETTDLNVDHTVLNILPWERSDIAIFLGKKGISVDSLDLLSEQDWSLLSIPYFANAFAAWKMRHAGNQGFDLSIFEVVVNLYLEREANKLLDQLGRSLVTVDELQSIFSEVSEKMHDSGRRELEISDLEFCVQLALGFDDLDANRPGLRSRLISLCGLSVDNFMSGGVKFIFSHEIMFDCFLSLSLQLRCLDSIHLAYMRDFFRHGEIHSSVLGWFVVNRYECAKNVLGGLISIDDESLVWKKNMGLFWTAILNHDKGIPPSEAIDGVVLEKVSLTGDVNVSLQMTNCTIQELSLPPAAFVIDLENTQIKCLSSSSRVAFKNLKNITPEQLQIINSGDEYCDNTASIRSFLETEGVIDKGSDYFATEWKDTVTYFIKNIVDRPDYPIVFSTDVYRTDDSRLNWTARLGHEKWVNFIDALLRNSLARLERIEASGRPKSKLMFDLSPNKIANRDKKYQNILDFWAGN